ncbi:hypothetical protein QE429_001868 [Bacillus sp. SORGH_AS 510]|uniref:hypothetical protein n=1 Tax=Bacillus sp. SORGH_AS_0510 TaxID=3041771 RepID=UPI00277E4F9A|nr:hypothetical protein [Bacillus sp. SORGH_AS_0510]MDQ1145041.1 hypothetical protein [Bacillus sp. SORGH_AS_0510]
MSNYLRELIGQIAVFKTITGEVLIVKVIGEEFEKQKHYKVKVFENNENGSTLEDFVIHIDDIKMICILPPEIQKGFNLTISYIPNQDNNKDFPNFIEFGELQDTE